MTLTILADNLLHTFVLSSSAAPPTKVALFPMIITPFFARGGTTFNLLKSFKKSNIIMHVATNSDKDDDIRLATLEAIDARDLDICERWFVGLELECLSTVWCEDCNWWWWVGRRGSRGCGYICWFCVEQFTYFLAYSCLTFVAFRFTAKVFGRCALHEYESVVVFRMRWPWKGGWRQSSRAVFDLPYLSLLNLPQY